MGRSFFAQMQKLFCFCVEKSLQYVKISLENTLN